MPEPTISTATAVYQLRIVLRGVSPLIWRRLLVRGDTTIADLHRTLQVAFGWSDEHLHRFVVHGRLYGTDSLFDSRRIHLADLGLRISRLMPRRTRRSWQTVGAGGQGDSGISPSSA